MNSLSSSSVICSNSNIASWMLFSASASKSFFETSKNCKKSVCGSSLKLHFYWWFAAFKQSSLAICTQYILSHSLSNPLIQATKLKRLLISHVILFRIVRAKFKDGDLLGILSHKLFSQPYWSSAQLKLTSSCIFNCWVF